MVDVVEVWLELVVESVETEETVDPDVDPEETVEAVDVEEAEELAVETVESEEAVENVEEVVVDCVVVGPGVSVVPVVETVEKVELDEADVDPEETVVPVVEDEVVVEELVVISFAKSGTISATSRVTPPGAHWRAEVNVSRLTTLNIANVQVDG